ncbi:Phage integrase family protein [anaerobic digester metagenome]
MPINRFNRRTKQREWYGKITDSGKTYTKKCASKKAAIEWEQLTRQELEARTHTGTVSLIALFNAYLDNVHARFSLSSYRDKARVFKLAVSRFGADTDVRKIGYRDIEDWTNTIKRKVSGITANRFKVHLVAAWNWGIKAMGLPEPCPWRVQKYKEESGEKYVPSEADFWACYQVAEPSEKVMLLAFLHLAARKSEVFHLRWSDVDWERDRVRIWTRKRDGGREYDLLPLSSELRQGLSEQRFRTGTSEWVFLNPDTRLPYSWHGKFLGRLCREAKVREFGYHSLRHLAACLLDESGEPLAYIQAMLRHKNAVTTSRYLHSLRGIRAPEKGAFAKKGARPGAQILDDSTQQTATY